ncbi:MAG: hypothetical protein IPH35_01240 [Rhodoferax sp.]|nr:hypothetical protein [Rhodoferax sp.]
MLQTIEVEIDARGCIHPLEPLPFEPVGRALLTLLQPDKSIVPAQPDADQCSAARALALLASPRYVRRPVSDPTEVQQRIAALRNDWRD